MRRKSFLGAAGWVLAVAAVGCQAKAGRKAEAEMQAVPVSHPVQRYVTDYVDFTGRTEAKFSVDVRARVSGYLTGWYFKEGADVKKGDLLFEIDPRPYQAQLDQALSQVRLNEASLKLARATYQRDRVAARKGAISEQQLDEDLAAVAEAGARVKAAESATKVSRLNLEFTRITSPIDGQISRSYLTPGNLVNQDQTLLTTIVSLDPMHVYFDLDEPTLIRIRKEIFEGRLRPLRDGSMSVMMGLQGEKGHPHKGTINFVNNQVNSTTGSITLRGVFPNPRKSGLPSLAATTAGLLGSFPGQGPLLAASALFNERVGKSGGEQLLSPGMFVRVRLPIGEPKEALLVIDRAIGSDQGLKYVYVLDGHNKVQYRPVETGALQADGRRVITKGLNPDDWVVVGGLPQIRARMEVRPDRTEMPSLASGQSARNTPAGPAPKGPSTGQKKG